MATFGTSSKASYERCWTEDANCSLSWCLIKSISSSCNLWHTLWHHSYFALLICLVTLLTAFPRKLSQPAWSLLFSSVSPLQNFNPPRIISPFSPPYLPSWPHPRRPQRHPCDLLHTFLVFHTVWETLLPRVPSRRHPTGSPLAPFSAVLYCSTTVQGVLRILRGGLKKHFATEEWRIPPRLILPRIFFYPSAIITIKITKTNTTTYIFYPSAIITYLYISFHGSLEVSQ